jgi:hypothetical protein
MERGSQLRKTAINFSLFLVCYFAKKKFLIFFKTEIKKSRQPFLKTGINKNHEAFIYRWKEKKWVEKTSGRGHGDSGQGKHGSGF